MIKGIPEHRVEDATFGILLEAGILSDLVLGLGGFQPGQEVSAMNDTAIFLRSLENGYAVLTRPMRNIHDFDLMAQLLPTGWVLFYRTL